MILSDQPRLFINTKVLALNISNNDKLLIKTYIGNHKFLDVYYKRMLLEAFDP